MAIAIAKIILGGSLFGIAAILFRKVPLLLEMPEEDISFRDLGGIIKIKLRDCKNFCFTFLSKKVVSKLKIMILRADKGTEMQIQKLKEKYRRKEFKSDDNYWQEIKRDKKD